MQTNTSSTKNDSKLKIPIIAFNGDPDPNTKSFEEILKDYKTPNPNDSYVISTLKILNGETSPPKLDLSFPNGSDPSNVHGFKDFLINSDAPQLEIKDFNPLRGDKITFDLGPDIKSIEDLLKNVTQSNWSGDDFIFELNRKHQVTIKDAKTNGLTPNDLIFKTTITDIIKDSNVYVKHELIQDKMKGFVTGLKGVADKFIVDTTTDKIPIEIKDFHKGEKDKIHLNTGLGVKSIEELTKHLKKIDWLGDDLNVQLNNGVDITIVGAKTNGIDVSDFNILG